MSLHSREIGYSVRAYVSLYNHVCPNITDVRTHRIMEMLVLVCKSVVFSSEAGA